MSYYLKLEIMLIDIFLEPFVVIFDTHPIYANPILGQNLNTVSRIIILQKIAVRIMNFQSRDSHSCPLFRSNHILKLEGKTPKENIFFMNSQLTTFYRQSLTVGSPSALIFTIIKQSHLSLKNYLNYHTELILTVKI